LELREVTQDTVRGNIVELREVTQDTVRIGAERSYSGHGTWKHSGKEIQRTTYNSDFFYIS